MANEYFSGYRLPWVEPAVQEPKQRYHTKTTSPLTVKEATVHTQFYPALKSSHYRSDRPVPWINLKGHWLAQTGFKIGSRYKIEVFENKLVLTIID